jgi:hypothetical protein
MPLAGRDQLGLPAAADSSYNKSQEAEAYDLGAALLLPKERIQLRMAKQEHATDIAGSHECSTDLVEHRIKRLRLWARYSGKCRVGSRPPPVQLTYAFWAPAITTVGLRAVSYRLRHVYDGNRQGLWLDR